MVAIDDNNKNVQASEKQPLLWVHEEQENVNVNYQAAVYWDIEEATTTTTSALTCHRSRHTVDKRNTDLKESSEADSDLQPSSSQSDTEIGIIGDDDPSSDQLVKDSDDESRTVSAIPQNADIDNHKEKGDYGEPSTTAKGTAKAQLPRTRFGNNIVHNLAEEEHRHHHLRGCYEANGQFASPLFSDALHLNIVEARSGLIPSDLASAAGGSRDTFLCVALDDCSTSTTANHELRSLASAFDQDELEQYGDGDLEEDENGEPRRVPLVAYFILTGAVIGLSSMGPLFALQKGVDPTLKTAWRNLASALFMLPLAAHSVYADGFPNLSAFQWMNCILAPVFFSAMLIAFSAALNYTTVGNVVILANSRTIILLVGRIIMGQPIVFLEGAGTVVAMLGAAMCSQDSADHNANQATNPFWGECLAILSAIFGVLYMAFAKQVRPHLNLSVFMFVFMALAAVESLLYMKLTGAPISFDADVSHGVMGWMNLQTDRLPSELSLVLICSMMGTMGYIRSMQYFSNLVLCVAVLLQPLVAEVMAMFLGVGVLPGWMGWVGNLLVIVGTLVVVQNPTSEKPKYDRKQLGKYPYNRESSSYQKVVDIPNAPSSATLNTLDDTTKYGSGILRPTEQPRSTR